MMAENKNIPEIRFAGFIDPWEQRKLADVLSSYTDPVEIPHTGYERLGIRSHAKGTFHSYVPAGHELQTAQMHKVAADKFIVNITFGWEHAVAVTDENDAGKLVSHRFPQFSLSEELDPKFLKFIILDENFRHHLWLASPGGAGRNRVLNLTEMLQYEIYIPSVSEQRQIADVLIRLDNLITLHQRRYDQLKNVKKSMLEKMFPRNGANVPEIRFAGFTNAWEQRKRFAGFTNAWEQRKVGDCFTERVESMPDGELISVTINDGIKKFSELGRHDNSNDDKSKYKKVCVGDIAYNSMRMWQGASGYSPYEGIVSPAYTVLSPNSGINSKCLAYQFKLPEIIHTFQVNSQGITSDNWNLKYPALSQIEIFVSKDEQEQAKIAKFFENLDNLITLHQRKRGITNLRSP